MINRELMLRALRYIARPSMGLPSGVDPTEFAMEGATEHNARIALSACIRMATEALSSIDRSDPDLAIKRLREAMQDAWNEFCSDTGCIPDAFTIHGPRTTKVTADFARGNFVEMVADRLPAHTAPEPVGWIADEKVLAAEYEHDGTASMDPEPSRDCPRPVYLSRAAHTAPEPGMVRMYGAAWNVRAWHVNDDGSASAVLWPAPSTPEAET